jgi:selenocysteine lyase/cysteine desulfurase
MRKPSRRYDRLVPTIAEARELWQPETVYLNTASFGLPPRPAWEALQAALGDWHGGRTSWEHWGEATERSREAFARLVGVPSALVATGAAVSPLVGLVAASLPDGLHVLAPDVEFTSGLWPFAAQGRRVRVTTVPTSRLAEAIDAGTDVVVFSAVQSSTGEVADLAGIAAAAAHHGALTVVDATQAIGWLPVDASRFDAVVCAGYKWLMCPRGTAFMSVRPALLEQVVPHAAGWWSGEDVHESYYGLPLRLTESARRLDTSPAWFCWVGTAPSLELIESIGVSAIHAHDVALANRFRAGLGLEPADSAIVRVEVAGAEERLAGSGIMTAVRAGRLRVSYHLYNTEADVDAILERLA